MKKKKVEITPFSWIGDLREIKQLLVLLLVTFDVKITDIAQALGLSVNDIKKTHKQEK
jgi:hypothetical protein